MSSAAKFGDAVKLCGKGALMAKYDIRNAYNSENLTWQISNNKANSITKLIDDFLSKRTTNLKEVQKLHGKLSDFAQMCQFIKGFRFNLSKVLGSFEGGENDKKIDSEIPCRRFAHLEKMHCFC